MLNLSLVINNHNPENLISIIDLLTNKIELIVINQQQYTNQKNTNILDIVNAKCQEKNILFKATKLQNNELICSNLSEVITGDFVIFTSSNYTPDEHWLDNIIAELSNSSFNIFTGQIIESENSINSSSLTQTLEYTQIWQKQMGNLAIRKDFLDKVNYFKFLNNNNCHDVIYCRLLRELENEIKYLPNVIVRSSIE